MAVIYLRHPQFGTKVATMDVEADYDKEHGWEEFGPVLDAADAEEIEVAPESAPTNAFEPPKRRGRPPRQESAA